MGRAALDLKNQRFGSLVVVKRQGRTRQNMIQWKCICDCGNIHFVSTGALRSGNTTSCGCVRFKNDDDKVTNHPLYDKWGQMRQRCKPEGEYGSQGIVVCERWMSFKNFISDMGESWQPGLTIERIDNDKGYSPDNCRWVKLQHQPMNRRCDKDIIVTLPDGTEQVVAGGHISEFCRHHGFDIRKMNDVLKKRRSHYKGYTAVYLNDRIPAWMRPFAIC